MRVDLEVPCGEAAVKRWPITQTEMARRAVHMQAQVSATADVVWAITRNFIGSWHPAITSMVTEQDGKVRRFKVKGEDTVYRERLTYFSDSEKTYSYQHVEGIRDVEFYDASFSVSAVDDLSCEIDWRASITAAEPRCTDIAEGTGFVFQMGIDALRATVPRRVITKGSPAIALTVAGKNSDCICLFLHGIGGGRQNWQKQLPLAASYMQSATMDLRGYGDSELGEAASTVDDYCNDILRVMSELEAKRVVICGLSYGAWIATSFAMRHADKLAGLVLSGGCTGMSEATAEQRENFRTAREVPLNQGKTPKDFALAVVDVIASFRATDLMRNELVDTMATIPAATYRDALQCFTQPSEPFDFSKLAVPVLFITGEHDKLATPAEICAVSRRVHTEVRNPNVRYEVLAGAGHVCNVEAPGAYNTLLGSFLSGIAQ